MLTQFYIEIKVPFGGIMVNTAYANYTSAVMGSWRIQTMARRLERVDPGMADVYTRTFTG